MKSFLDGSIDDAFADVTQAADTAAVCDLSFDNDCTVQAATAAADSADDEVQSDVSANTADADIVDDYLKPPVMHCHWQPLALVVGVPALPRGALVEVQPQACTVEATTYEASVTSNDDESVGQSEEQDQIGSSNRSDWGRQLMNTDGLVGSNGTGHWSSLTSHEAYCCCQVVFGAQRNSLESDLGQVMQTLSNSLAAAGLTAEHVISLTAYAHETHGSILQQIESSFQAHWEAYHAQQVPLVLIPVWLMMSGVGAELTTNTHSQVCFRLIAHQRVKP